MEDVRKSKGDYYLDIADMVSKRSTCLRRHYGAVIVKNDEIVATGYNGAPRGDTNCIDIKYCEREAQGVAHGERYELCKAVHAEANAIISASRSDMIDSTLYLSGTDFKDNLIDARPCDMCMRLIKNAGIMKIIQRNADNTICVTDVRGLAVLNALKDIFKDEDE